MAGSDGLSGTLRGLRTALGARGAHVKVVERELRLGSLDDQHLHSLSSGMGTNAAGQLLRRKDGEATWYAEQTERSGGTCPKHLPTPHCIDILLVILGVWRLALDAAAALGERFG